MSVKLLNTLGEFLNEITYWIIPSILTSSISSTSSIRMDVLANSRMQRCKLHLTRIRDERHSEVRMIVRVDNWSCRDNFFDFL